MHADRIDQLFRRSVFEHEPACTGAQRRMDIVVEVERGQHHHPGVGVAFADRAARLDAVQDRHPDIHQHDVGVRASSELDGRCPVGRLADDCQVGLGLQDHAESDPDHLLVVDQHHADHGRLPADRR